MKIQLIIISMLILFSAVASSAQERKIRLAKLQIDPAQLDAYNTLLKEEIEASVRVEPGVLMLYAVAEKEHPSKITILEIYASEEAYKLHIQTPHFLKYKNGTKEMVRSLELVEVDPVAFGLKEKMVLQR